MAWRERLAQTVALWPYMIPLIGVYFAEYAMQTGTWTAIGLLPSPSCPPAEPACCRGFAMITKNLHLSAVPSHVSSQALVWCQELTTHGTQIGSKRCWSSDLSVCVCVCVCVIAGFPVTDAAARHRFYSASNWCYQVGVFVSRSSGLAYQV